jgi:hypothetical protein
MKAMKSRILASVFGLLLLSYGTVSVAAPEGSGQLKTFTSAEKAAALSVGGEGKERKPLIERNGGGTRKTGSAVASQAGKATEPAANKSTATDPGITVNLGNIRIEDVVIKGAVGNGTTIKDSENLVVGEANTANMGGVAFVGGSVGKTGSVGNKSSINSTLNLAMGRGNTTNVGAVAATNSKADGKVDSVAKTEAVANISIGVNNTANMGTVNLENANLGKASAVVNTSTSKKSTNIGIGMNNNTSAGSLHIE